MKASPNRPLDHVKGFPENPISTIPKESIKLWKLLAEEETHASKPATLLFRSRKDGVKVSHASPRTRKRKSLRKPDHTKNDFYYSNP